MILRVVAFVLPLGLDTFAIAVALGLRGNTPWVPALIFAMFEAVMPVFGIALAHVVSLRFERAAVIIGGVLLIGVGIHVLREALEDGEDLENISFGSLRSSLLAGVAISMDELAIGFPLGVSRLPIGIVLAAIAVQAFFVTAVGVMLGNRVSSSLGHRASRIAGIAAGIVFMLVGLWLIIERSILHG